MTSAPLQRASFAQRRDSEEPQTALPAMLVGGGLSLLLWALFAQLLLAVVR